MSLFTKLARMIKNGILGRGYIFHKGGDSSTLVWQKTLKTQILGSDGPGEANRQRGSIQSPLALELADFSGYSL